MKRYAKNVSEWRYRQEAPDVAATVELQRLMDLEQFMQTTRSRNEQAILAFILRPTKGPTISPKGSPSHPDITDIEQSVNPDIPPASMEPSHTWGNRLGYSY